ncbi:MAG: hypothetical protein IJ774_03975 [Selenomonadaceae bacterium]|nr:hypothetical protein [Selenomonadaceae bacterium]
MKKFFYNRTLLIVVGIGLFAALIIAGQRYVVESNNMQVDMAADFRDIAELAAIEGLELDDVLKQVKDAGITSLAVYDSTLERLNRAGKVFAIDGSEILSNYQSGTLSNDLWRQTIEFDYIKPNRVYIIGGELESYYDTKEALFQRLGNERVRVFAVGGIEVIEVKGYYGELMKMPLGLPRDEMDKARAAGFMILARPMNFHKCTSENIQFVFDRIKNYPISEIVFDGPEVLGASNFLDMTAQLFTQRNLTFGVIEHFTQLQFYPQTGMYYLAQRIGEDHVARLYAIPKDEQPKLAMSAAVNRWSTTDRERNIRINLLRPYGKALPELTLLETNLKYFRDVHDVLERDGFTFGKAGTFENYYPNVILRVLVIVGVVAAGVLYLSLISRRLNRKPKLQLQIFAVLALAAAIPVLIGAGGKIRLLAAFMSASLFPALAIIWQLDLLRVIQYRIKIRNRVTRLKENLSTFQLVWTSAFALLVTGVLSMTGAAYLSGALSDVSYFLEFEIFRGIKLTFVLPPILVAVAFLQRFNVVDEVRKNVPAVTQIKELLDRPVTVKTFLVLLIVLGGLVVLVLRSGHTSGMPVSGVEIKIRAMLEQLFYARPRSKEIFFGHPAFMLAFAAFLKKFPKMICFVLVLAATIGQGSMVETFAHMRTPILMSFMRGLDGLIPGALIGAVLIIFLQVVFFARQRKE